MIAKRFENLLGEIQVEWNKAEKAIKIAEQIDNEVVNPAVKELRYAGRRVVEALGKSSTDHREVERLLVDANYNCLRSRHDAIDAATSKMVGDLEASLKHLGADAVLPTFPQMPKLLFDLNEIRGKIAISRENRENRNATYESIQRYDLAGNVLDVFMQFRISEPLMKAAATKRERVERQNKLFAVGGLILGILGVAVGIFF